MENCHTWIIISMWQNDLHTNTSRSVWPILYSLMIKMLQYKMYPAGELAVLRQLLLIIIQKQLFSKLFINQSTVNVLKFQTLDVVPFFLPKFCCFFYAFIPQNTWWKGKQCRPWLDCSQIGSLIWVCTVCICHFILHMPFIIRKVSVQNFRPFTIYLFFFLSAHGVQKEAYWQESTYGN